MCKPTPNELTGKKVAVVVVVADEEVGKGVWDHRASTKRKKEKMSDHTQTRAKSFSFCKPCFWFARERGEVGEWDDDDDDDKREPTIALRKQWWQVRDVDRPPSPLLHFQSPFRHPYP